MGNFAFQEPLSEDMSRYRASETPDNDRPLLAIGTMPAITGRPESKPVPFLASATGDSGELLRLTVADQTDWQWGDDKDAYLQLSVIDPMHSEREITWGANGLPITQVKFVEGLSNQVYVRWLLVQKQTSTTILQPEHHPVPIPVNTATDESAPEASAALVKANPILKLYHTDTGGNAHSDVVFSPAAFGQNTQLVVIDECGFWSIWNLMGTYRVAVNTVRVMLRSCGHINEGPLPEFPSQHGHRAEKHGLLVVSKPSEASLDLLETNTRSGFSTAPVVLMWKAECLQAVDMHSGALLSPLKKFWAPERGNRIIDVQKCPVSPGRIFVLTERSLLWVEIRRDERAPVIVQTVPHVGIGIGSAVAKMTTCTQDSDTAMVFTFSLESRQLAVHWFTEENSGGLARWHRHVSSLPGADDASSPSAAYQIHVTPLQLYMSEDNQRSGTGSSYQQHGVTFFQLNILSNTLGIRYGICTTSYSPELDITLPTKRLGWSMTEQQREWKKRRRHFLQHFQNTFVLPDGMTERDLAAVMQRRDNGEDQLVGQREQEVKVPQPVRLNMERLCRVVGPNLVETQRQGPKGLPRDLFEAIRDMFDNSEPGGSTPMATWHQLAEAVGDDAELDDVNNGMEAEIERLFDAADDNKVVPQVRRANEKEPADALVSFTYLYNEYGNFWLSNESRLTEEVQNKREAWVAEVARNMLFSSYGVLIQDVPVFGPQNSEASQGYSNRGPPSSAVFSSSPRSSQMSHVTESTTGSEGAIARLRLLAPSLGLTELTTSKSHNLLSYWPAERGQDTDDYVSTVAVASDDKFRDARERLQRKEAKRRSHVEEFRRQSIMRQSMGRSRDDEPRGPSPGPARVQIMSSQAGPSSSQTQGPSVPPVTMSQPVSGAFGARKKKTKPKRKSGFR